MDHTLLKMLPCMHPRMSCSTIIWHSLHPHEENTEMLSSFLFSNFLLFHDEPTHRIKKSRQDKCCPKVTPQSTAKTTRIILDCYMYGSLSQFLLRVCISNYAFFLQYIPKESKIMVHYDILGCLVTSVTTKYCTVKEGTIP